MRRPNPRYLSTKLNSLIVAENALKWNELISGEWCTMHVSASVLHSFHAPFVPFHRLFFPIYFRDKRKMAFATLGRIHTSTAHKQPITTPILDTNLSNKQTSWSPRRCTVRYEMYLETGSSTISFLAVLLLCVRFVVRVVRNNTFIYRTSLISDRKLNR